MGPNARAARLPWAALLLVAMQPGVAEADVTGRWQVTLNGGPPYVDFVQTGADVEFDMQIGAYLLHFTGTVDGPELNATSSDGPCPAYANLVVMPDDFTLDGTLGVFGGTCPQPSKDRMIATRCECDDGDEDSGDGCDATCRIEPCFTCTGAPSVCTPQSDGASCDDRLDCTSGETCSAGVCGSGAPVVPCFDLSGRWLRQIAGDGPVPFYETRTDVTQRDGLLRFYDDGILGPIGYVDTATGEFWWQAPGPPACAGTSASGDVAADGRSWLAAGMGYGVTPHFLCAPYQFYDYGYRCGNGLVDDGEVCDDADRESGDGCSDACQVELCWQCDNDEPSACTADEDAVPCDDGDPCTTGDTCSDTLCSGTPVSCPSCTACDATGACVPGARSGCLSLGEPERARLQIFDRADDSRDSLRWIWKKGPALEPVDFGDPTDASSVAMCVFDASGLAFQAELPAGDPWDQASDGGFSYRDGAGSADGITSVSLRPGAAGRSSIQVRGKGSGLEASPLGLPSAPLALPLRVQLQTGGGECFESEYAAAGIKKNDAGLFKASGTE